MKKVILIVVSPEFQKPPAQGEPTRPGANPTCIQRIYEGENLHAPAQGNHIVLDRSVPGTYKVSLAVPDIENDVTRVCVQAPPSVLKALIDNNENWTTHDILLESETLLIARG